MGWRKVRVLSLCLLPALLSFAQTAPRPQFEVASLKLNDGCQSIPRPGNLSPSPGRLEIPCVNLQNLIQMAYGTFGDGATINPQPLHLEGGPAWMQSEFFSISAKGDGPVRTELLGGPMLQVFLEDRFQLKLHREMREAPVYTMTVGRGGLKVQRLAEGACNPIDLTHPPPPGKAGDPPPNLCGIMMTGPTGKGDMMIEVRGATMTQLAQRLSGRVDRKVVDKTGVEGKYNVRLEFTPDPGMRGQAMPPTDSASPPSGDTGLTIFAALQEQIGLKLTPDKGQVEFLIIDRVEKPSGN